MIRTLLVVGWIAALSSRAVADDVVVQRTDGTVTIAADIAIDARAGTTLSRADGSVETLALDGIVAIAFRSTASAAAARGNAAAAPTACVQLHDGSRIVGAIRGGDEEHLDFELARGPRLKLPIDTLHAIFAGPHAAELDAARFAAAADGDSLHRRAEVGGDFTRGTLAAFSADGVKFEYSLGTGQFPWSEIEALVLKQQVELEPLKPPRVHVDLVPDGSLNGTLERLTAQEIVVTPQGFTDAITLPRSGLAGLRFDGPSHRWLSDLAPSRVEQVPYIGPKEQFLYSWRADRSVTGRPLVVRGERFAKGFGCHSRTVLEFALDGSFSSFRASVGVADEVMALSDRGAIEFRLLVDGVETWKSSILRAGDAAVAVGPIKLGGAKSLSLITDFGEGEDVADRGVWGAPLLLK